jgi:hypothetical protein
MICHSKDGRYRDGGISRLIESENAGVQRRSSALVHGLALENLNNTREKLWPVLALQYHLGHAYNKSCCNFNSTKVLNADNH